MVTILGMLVLILISMDFALASYTLNQDFYFFFITLLIAMQNDFDGNIINVTHSHKTSRKSPEHF